MQSLWDLSSVAEGDSLVRPAADRLALVTGQSVPSNIKLSPEQIAFLDAVAPPGVDVLAHGFPFLRSYEGAVYRRPSLATAAIANAQQYLASHLSPRFRSGIAARIEDLFAKTQGTLLLITGSCGIRFLDAAWPELNVTNRRVHIIALGPANVGRLIIPKQYLTTIRGTRDGWSKALFRGAIDHDVPCGHLDYWTCPTTIALVRALLADRLAGLRAR
jgi:hypothetical protein